MKSNLNKRELYENIMKSVSKIIKKHLNESEELLDSEMFESDEDETDFMELFTKRRLPEAQAAAFFWEVLSEAVANKTPFILSKESGRNNLYNRWMRKFPTKLSREDTKYIMRKYGRDAARFAKNILENEDAIHELEFEKNAMSKRTNQSGFGTTSDIKRKLKANEYKKIIGRGYSISELPNIELEDDERLLLIRPKYKGAEPLLYPFKGKLTHNRVNPYKYVYAYESTPRVNYYATRPILWETVKDDPERQQCSASWEIEDDIYED